jgi:hypothetical protein
LAGGQISGAGEQIGVAQAAQGKTHAVSARTAAKGGTQVGPGVAELVFVKSGLGFGLTPVFGSRNRLHALVRHVGCGTGEADFANGIASPTAVKINLHVHDGDARAADPENLSTVGQRPLLNGDGGMGLGCKRQ